MDLFAGSGALCLEALSRGAKEVVMVEKSSLAIRSLRENVDRLDAANVRIIDQDALDVLNRRYAELARPEAFDVIFVDPPFRAGLIDPVIQAIEQGGWLKPGGLLYVEAPSTTKNPPLSAVWEKYRSKTTGQVGYHLFYYHP
jgi:16S rRNA (guanine966-N2)-methyltransferase